MKVSFGIINYNRLFYLKSCAETLMKSVEDYEGEVEFICIDDNSKEKDTKEYLKTLSDRGWKVINQQDYRPSNKKDIGIIQDVIDEFSSALNLFYELSTGEIIAPLQGDTQFVRKNWLQDYVSLFSERDDVFAAFLDAQRKVRLESADFVDHTKHGNNIFAVNPSRIIPGAGDCFYKRKYLQEMNAWSPEQATNAEDLFTSVATGMFPNKKVYMPWLPVSIGIFTDPRGTNGRVRGNVRYGLYWEALNDNRYYEWVDLKEVKINKNRPASIEELAKANGDWELPINTKGDWKKNPINWPLERENVDYEEIC
jgi:hypothetical protein